MAFRAAYESIDSPLGVRFRETWIFFERFDSWWRASTEPEHGTGSGPGCARLDHVAQQLSQTCVGAVRSHADGAFG